MEKRKKYLELREKIVSCTKCRLRKGALQVVPGAGSLNAKVMFIGEAPGANEDKQGVPFVGAAGKFLNTLLESIDLNKNKVFITNVVKCRPPNNREPQPDEIEACKPWLDQQIETVQPKIFVPLGRYALSLFLPNKKVSIDHGKIFSIKNKHYFISYHPAVALYRGSMREVLLEDFQKLKNFLNGKKESIQPSSQVSDIIHSKAKYKSIIRNKDDRSLFT